MTEIKINPARKVVICKNPADQVTKSGLVLPSGESKPETGEVYAIGTGKPSIPIKKGDIIIFRKYTDNRIFIKGIEFNFISFKDILGVLQD